MNKWFCSIYSSKINHIYIESCTIWSIKVYNFNTSWCGWSTRFQPEWKKFENEISAKGDLSHVQAYDIKCDNPANDNICKEYEVAGFPTVIIEAAGKRGVYKGPRDSKDLLETVKAL